MSTPPCPSLDDRYHTERLTVSVAKKLERLGIVTDADAFTAYFRKNWLNVRDHTITTYTYDGEEIEATLDELAFCCHCNAYDYPSPVNCDHCRVAVCGQCTENATFACIRKLFCVYYSKPIPISSDGVSPGGYKCAFGDGDHEHAYFVKENDYECKSCLDILYKQRVEEEEKSNPTPDYELKLPMCSKMKTARIRRKEDLDIDYTLDSAASSASDEKDGRNGRKRTHADMSKSGE